jgi:hypothetical protein
MGQRLDLHEKLLAIMPAESKNVYFQPPENLKMQYPCIRYEREFADTQYADNLPYAHAKRYRLTVITQDPDSEIPDMVKQLPYTSFQRFFVAEDLNHDVINIYF